MPSTNPATSNAPAGGGGGSGNPSSSKKKYRFCLNKKINFYLVPPRAPVAGNNSSFSAGVSSYLPSSIKGLNTSGKSWMKNILDTSSKVINEGVQQVKQ